MKRNFLLLFFCFYSLLVFSQNKYTISGYVQDGSSGENLIGVSIYDNKTFKGTTTNNYGFYSLTLTQGKHTIVFSFMGMHNQEFEINLIKNTKHNIELASESILTEEINVSAERTKNIESTKVSQVKLDVQKVKQMPAIMGEVDILKTIQLLPGVQSAGEGNAGFYVRGGGPDHNLILLDEATVYNASHLFGFFSVFNADAIKDINLIKGGMPAQYGGRLASVLDISMKDGNNQKFGAEGGIGIISSRLTLEGPIVKNKSSFIVSGRRTYIDILSKPFLSESARENGYYFYDLTAKANYKFSDKDRLYLSGYFGKDIFNFGSPNGGFGIEIPWGNTTTSLRWNHLFNDKLFLNTSIIYSDYLFELGVEQSQFEFKLSTQVTDWNTKFDFTYLPNIRHNIKFGIQYTFHTFIPASVSGQSGEVSFSPATIFKQYANEGSLYFSDDYELTDRIKLNFGGRFTAFQHGGHIAVKDMITNEFKQNKEDQYRHFEPRLSARYSINPTTSLKSSYTKNYQYIHLASLGGMSMPMDLWLPSSAIIQPTKGVQYTTGIFKNFKNNSIETSIELYYKDMENLIEYKEGAFPEDNANGSQDELLTFGDGQSYGAEFFVKKSVGKTTGWLGYTHSYTFRTFPDVNEGDPYPAKYDRRHDFSAVATHQLNDKWTFSSVFVYATGSAITIPIERYVIDGNIYTEFTTKNGYRMDAYHRLDISATYTPKPHKKYKSSWNFSVYNVYNRLNPYFIYLDIEGDGSLEEGGLTPTATQVSLFPIIPSVTWNFKF
ncbi:MAG: TonB-dependent receptor [Flavobacteriales bacterium]|nr:TonB-dependent receptor [Flavobacteriales bacterium]